MKAFPSIIVALAVAAGATPVWSANDEQHPAHHPAANASAPAASNLPGRADPAAMAVMEAQMKSMHEVHEKLMAAKTPGERNAVMAEHMKIMQDGMASMNKMSSGMKGNFVRNKMMEKRMEMMEAMMEMMMDRLPR